MMKEREYLGKSEYFGKAMTSVCTIVHSGVYIVEPIWAQMQTLPQLVYAPSHEQKILNTYSIVHTTLLSYHN